MKKALPGVNTVPMSWCVHSVQITSEMNKLAFCLGVPDAHTLSMLVGHALDHTSTFLGVLPIACYFDWGWRHYNIVKKMTKEWKE